jgi:hypothetical protein
MALLLAMPSFGPGHAFHMLLCSIYICKTPCQVHRRILHTHACISVTRLLCCPCVKAVHQAKLHNKKDTFLTLRLEQTRMATQERDAFNA